jgi:hypothetical protein
LKDGRDDDAIKKLGQHVYSGYELFLSEKNSTKGDAPKSKEKGECPR